MDNSKKRITWIVIGGLFAFGLLFGVSRISAYAREAVMGDGGGLQSVRLTVQPSKVSLSKQVGEYEVYGTVQALSLDSVVIEGRTFIILPETEFKGQIQVGDFVKVHVYPFGEDFAVREIEGSTPGAMDDNTNGDDNGNTNGDDNGNTNGDDNGNTNGNDDNGNDDDGYDDDDDNDNDNDDDDDDNDDDD